MGIEGLKLYTVEEVHTKVLEGKVGRNSLYTAIKSGALKHIRIGRRVLITEAAIEAWLTSLTRGG